MKFGKSTVCLVLGLVWGCNSDRDADEKVGTQGLQITSTITQSADVAGIRFLFQPVSCEDGSPAGDPLVVDRPLEDFTIPGGIPELENAPLDAESAHLFADAFQTLGAGCYDVTAVPIQDSGDASNMCESAWEKAVVVEEGKTTEIFLINQCHGTDPGAIDAIATLNHEPEIGDVSFDESKFISCGESQTVCATVTDPDHDPLEFVWTLDASAPATAGPRVVRHTEDEATGAVTECVEFDPAAPGKFPVSLKVYDLLWKDGELMRIEDWLAAEGYPSESHAEFEFFFYVASDLSPLSRLTFSAKHLGPHAGVLMLDSTINGGLASEEAQAALALGLTVDIVDAATWGAMSESDFGEYRAIVLGDRACSSDFSPAEPNAEVWGSAANGNVIVIGTDESLHLPQGRPLTEASMAFVTADPEKTGALVSLSCFYHYYSPAEPFTPVPVLNGFGSFTTTKVGDCYNDVHIVATHPAMASVTDATLSDWGCSVHEGFDSWPASFSVLAIAENAGDTYTAGDRTVGIPYILARGVTEVGCGDATVAGAEECDDGGNVDGDGCDANCRLEACGNELLQSGEECDDGNSASGDGCSENCKLEVCGL